jgi:hypothetical protein
MRDKIIKGFEKNCHLRACDSCEDIYLTYTKWEDVFLCLFCENQIENEEKLENQEKVKSNNKRKENKKNVEQQH